MKNFRILVTGSNSQIAKEIKIIYKKLNNFKFFFLTKSNLDISDSNKIKKIILSYKINIIINCAAYTNVDEAENDKKQCKKINFFAVKRLALLCKSMNLILIHFSTDYVFNGNSKNMYNENSKTNPLNYYGYTKLLADEAILKISPHGMIIRTSWVFSSFGKNFVKTIYNFNTLQKEISVVSDQYGTPTFARDIAINLCRIISSKNFTKKIHPIKIYNFSSGVKTTWYEFAKEIYKNKKLITPISSNAYKYKTNRPHNSSLKCNRVFKHFNIKFPHWKISLKKCIADIEK
jgi:dTDP-4-dehydrorhamnose reductase